MHVGIHIHVTPKFNKTIRRLNNVNYDKHEYIF